MQVAAATNAHLTEELANEQHPHFLRTMGPLNPETLSTYGNRLAINRNSAYSPPKWAEGLASGLPGFDTRQCSSGITATLNPATPENPAFEERIRRSKGNKEGTQTPLTAEEIRKEAEDLFKRIKQYAFAEQSSTSTVPAPGCAQQAPGRWPDRYGPGRRAMLPPPRPRLRPR